MRHGLPVGGKKLRGKTDDEISATGIAQMYQNTDGLEVDIVLSSPLKRCSTFALAFSEKQNIKCIFDKKLEEIDFGDWDGVAYSELFNDNNSEAEQYLADPWHQTIPNGEPLNAFYKRIKDVINDILNEHKGKNILIITHAGVIRQVIADVLNIEKPNASCQQNIKINYASLVNFSVFTDDTNSHFFSFQL
jgi:alpha-ribazole phosphatase